jgi:uncharacterized protein (DUF885 family)
MNQELEQYFEEILDITPSFAAYLGYKSKRVLSRFENTISDEHIQQYKAILDRHKGARDPTLRYAVKMGTRALKFPFHLMPMNSFENPITEFDFLNKTVYPRNKELYNMRKQDFAIFIDTAIARMREGVSNKITIPNIICKELIRDVPKGYEPLKRFLKEEYMPACRHSIGLCALPNGRAMYRFLVENYCTFYMSPAKIHALGKKEVAELSKKLSGINKPKPEYFSSRKELMAAYKDNYEKIVRDILPAHFSYIPKTRCKIEPMPKNMQESGAGAYYFPRLNIFYVNTRDLKEHDKANMFTLTMHETVPGHHYHFAYMEEHGLSYAKQYSIDNTALIEGWALYSETLGPQTHGAVAAQLFRAVRLVVDTGVHYFGWPYEKALTYMQEHLPYKKTELETELKRYICIPGQALAYSLGKHKILSLKKGFMGAGLGDEKDFHEFLLKDGIVPFSAIKLDELKKKNLQ